MIDKALRDLGRPGSEWVTRKAASPSPPDALMRNCPRLGSYFMQQNCLRVKEDTLPFEWAVVFVVFAIACLVAYAVSRQEASGKGPRNKSPHLSSERPSQLPLTVSRVELRRAGYREPAPSTPDTALQNETSSPEDETDQSQVKHHQDSQTDALRTESWLNEARSDSAVTEGASDEFQNVGLEPGPASQLREASNIDLDSAGGNTIVYGLDPGNDSDDNRSWSHSEERRLLHCYGDNEDWDIVDLARHFGTTSRSIVITLMFLLLEPQGPIEDHRSPRWRQPWTQDAVDDVHDLFRTGASLSDIARTCGRDQLSVAFRLFRDRLPEVHGVADDFLTM